MKLSQLLTILLLCLAVILAYRAGRIDGSAYAFTSGEAVLKEVTIEGAGHDGKPLVVVCSDPSMPGVEIN